MREARLHPDAIVPLETAKAEFFVFDHMPPPGNLVGAALLDHDLVRSDVRPTELWHSITFRKPSENGMPT